MILPSPPLFSSLSLIRICFGFSTLRSAATEDGRISGFRPSRPFRPFVRLLPLPAPPNPP
jgi:hypothetical protein